MYNLKTKNVVIVCIAVVLCSAMFFGTIVHESIINHNKGPWHDQITITVDREE